MGADAGSDWVFARLTRAAAPAIRAHLWNSVSLSREARVKGVRAIVIDPSSRPTCVLRLVFLAESLTPGRVFRGSLMNNNYSDVKRPPQLIFFIQLLYLIILKLF